jgi:hypothetical protein
MGYKIYWPDFSLTCPPCTPGDQYSQPAIRTFLQSQSQRFEINLASTFARISMTCRPCSPRKPSNRHTRVIPSGRKNLIAPMAYRVTKPHSPRGSARANVETMGGRRSRYWCGLCSGGETKPALCLSDIRQWSAPHLLTKENDRQEQVTQGFNPSQPSPRPHGFGARAG